jgi:hypothetical protein
MPGLDFYSIHPSSTAIFSWYFWANTAIFLVLPAFQTIARARNNLTNYSRSAEAAHEPGGCRERSVIAG